MGSQDFYAHAFDEGTLTKLAIFELYAREWLPVFLARAGDWQEVHVYDFFAGPGTDPTGVKGSPLRLLHQLAAFQTLPGWRSTRIHAHFYDSDPAKIDALKQAVTGAPSGVTIEIEALEFEDAFKRNDTVLRRRKAAKLLLIDQFGVDNVTPLVFRAMASAPTTDFLFFLSSSTLHRFRDHPAIRQKINRPGDHYHVHRAALEYYRSLLPPGEYYLAPFSIKKGANIYGVIFGSSHPLGMDKFLQVAWTKDAISGEANFDIHRDNIVPGQPKFDLEEFKPTKVSAFERELEADIRRGVVRDERDVIQLCFRHGVQRQHASPVLSKLKRESVIDIGFRVPDIRRRDQPRPIRVRL